MIIKIISNGSSARLRRLKKKCQKILALAMGNFFTFILRALPPKRHNNVRINFKSMFQPKNVHQTNELTKRQPSTGHQK